MLPACAEYKSNWTVSRMRCAPAPILVVVRHASLVIGTDKRASFAAPGRWPEANNLSISSRRLQGLLSRGLPDYRRMVLEAL
jgi:hypothetical protein